MTHDLDSSRWLSPILVLLLCLLSCAACGDTSRAEAGTANDGSGSAEEAATQQEQGDDGPSRDYPPELATIRNGETWVGDFDEMRKRRIIRALVTYNKTNYFLDGARQRGLSYEALKELEKKINETLRTGTLQIHVVIVPVTRDQLLPQLREGRSTSA